MKGWTIDNNKVIWETILRMSNQVEDSVQLKDREIVGIVLDPFEIYIREIFQTIKLGVN